MCVQRKLTIEEKLKISAMSKAGKRQRTISRELGIDVRQIRKFQRENSLPVPQNGIAPSVIAEICELTKKGVEQRTIAHKLQLNPITIYKYQRLHGLPTHRAPFQVPEKLEGQVIRDLQRGLSQRQIAQRVPLTLFYIRKIARGHKSRMAA
jgi:predicted transcriptional regulator